MNVYLCRFYTTGEQWNTVICATEKDVEKLMSNYRMTKDEIVSRNGYSWWVDSVDKSQTASSYRHLVIGYKEDKELENA